MYAALNTFKQLTFTGSAMVLGVAAAGLFCVSLGGCTLAFLSLNGYVAASDWR